MVKTAAGVVIFCEVLLLALSLVSAVQQLDSINDLKRVGFGQSVPIQGLVLLHWFANTIDISYDGIFLTFDPNSDYGSHHYGNYDGVLDNVHNNRYRYYTVGNTNTDTQQQLPNHIYYPRTSDSHGNSARIIFRVREQNMGRQSRQIIDEVYMTQHYGHGGTEYDPQHTYRITTNLLRQIRSFPMNGNYNSLRNLGDRYNVDNNQLWNIQQEWDGLVGLGLLLFIVLQRVNNQSHTVPTYYRLQSDNSRNQTRRDTESFSDCPQSYVLIICFLIVILVLVGAFLGMTNSK